VDISRSLDRPGIVLSYEVVDHRTWDKGSYIRLVVNLQDGSILHVREYISETERDYSYHWQTPNNDLVCRWDNSRHHNELTTFPHHKHRGGKVLESSEISLEDILSAISKKLSCRQD
jgi:hypothetical protein